MGQQLAFSLTPGQLAIIVCVFGSINWWGFKRLIAGIDARFDKIEKRFEGIPTRRESDALYNGLERRVVTLETRVFSATSPGFVPKASE